MYSPIVAIEVAAAKATLEPSEGMASRNARNAAKQIVRMGAANRMLTELKNRGSPPVHIPESALPIQDEKLSSKRFFRSN